jgi:hydroxymethylpyrimidine pyrophosphatase-like HAD family hydrolase
MRYLALATDYDGTLAHDGIVDETTLDALKRLRSSGRKLILVTGRELPDLENVFPHFNLFDRIVAENGALLFNPATREKHLLAKRPPDEFIADLKTRNVSGLSVGEVIVATWHPYEAAVLESIRQLGLELQVIFNKDAVMVLPASVNKMTGLRAALSELKLSRHNVVGVGDAENDHAFLNCCECSVAVANAIVAIKERVDLVTNGERGAGVVELIDKVLDDDLCSLPMTPEKHGVLLGRTGDEDLYIAAQGQTILLSGQSGAGKSTFVAGLAERLIERDYQVCLIDPEGDYESVPGLLTVGDEQHPPSFEQISELLENSASNLIINFVGVKMQDRPSHFASLLTRLQERNLHQGRPHWLIVDEAHHLLPSDWAPASAQVAGQIASLLLITVHPEHVSPALLRQVSILAVVGNEPHKSAEEFAKAINVPAPSIQSGDLGPGEVSIWFHHSNKVINCVRSVPGHAERKRHRRKYAEGALEPERVFHFRGPGGKMNLRAQNLMTFAQIAAGIDDDTWLFHLHRGDYSNWLSHAIKDVDLGKTVSDIEKDSSLSTKQTRDEIIKAIEEKYTVPA